MESTKIQYLVVILKKSHEELEINLFLKPRPGVAKITNELKKQILNYV